MKFQNIRAKLCFAVLALLLSVCTSRASHHMGGDLSVKKQLNGDYKAVLLVYGDSSQFSASMPATELVLVYKQNPATGTWDSVRTLTLSRVPVAANNLADGSRTQFEAVQYEAPSGAAGLYLTAGTYRFFANPGTRNFFAVVNATQSSQSLVGLYAVLKIPASGNSSPTWSSPPVVHVPVNQPFRFNPGLYDADGDSVTCALSTPLERVFPDGAQIRLAGWTPPAAAASDSLSFVPATGMLSWTPSMQGHFQQGFLLKEYRNGVLLDSVVRDFQYIVEAGSPPPAVQSVSANVQHASGGTYDYLYYKPDTPLTFQMAGTVIGGMDSVFLTGSGALLSAGQAQFSTSRTSATAVTGTVTWTPPAGTTGDKILFFRARNKEYSNDRAVILRPYMVPPLPSQSIAATAGQERRFLVYPNPAHRVLHLDLRLPAGGTAEVLLTGLSGQVLPMLHRKVLPGGHVQDSREIDVPAGTYVAVLLVDGVWVATQSLQIR